MKLAQVKKDPILAHLFSEKPVELLDLLALFIKFAESLAHNLRRHWLRQHGCVARRCLGDPDEQILAYGYLHAHVVQHVHGLELELSEKLPVQLVLHKRQVVADYFGAYLAS